MSVNPIDARILRYANQSVMKTMASVRGEMRGSNRLRLREVITDTNLMKDPENPTKSIDRETEELLLRTLATKFGKIGSISSFVVLSEEIGIREYSTDSKEGGCVW